MTNLQPHIDSDAYGASHCPICRKAPRVTIEDAVWPTVAKTKDVVLRCPQDDPYVALGETLQEAVKHWNIYIEFRNREAHHLRMMPQMDHTLSTCKSCLKDTRTILTVDKGQYVEQCAGCHLIKAIKEVE